MPNSDSVVIFPSTNATIAKERASARRRTHALVLTGSLVMLFSSTTVSGINFASNVVMARLLGPAMFGQVAVAATLLMMASCITLSFQMVCAKFVARNETAGGKSAVYHGLLKNSWIVSLCIGLILVAAQKPVARYLNVPSSLLIAILAVGITFYAPVGVRRGAMQGLCLFTRLSGTYVVEAVTRFVIGVALVLMGYGVLGGVGAISIAVVMAYFIPAVPKSLRVKSVTEEPASFAEAFQAIVFFVGQVIINNIDIVLVKHFFPPEQAGLYAAVALVGRVLYFAAWSVVSAMFPVSASVKQEHESPNVIWLPMALVGAISALFILVVSLFPQVIMGAIFGRAFASTSSLLLLYAIATAIYALSMVLMAYEISRRIANVGWLQLWFSGILVLVIGVYHHSLREVILVQIVLMSLMLALVSFPFLRRFRRMSMEVTP
jgi:O-antigen/teichoic acid export membrane protein